MASEAYMTLEAESKKLKAAQVPGEKWIQNAIVPRVRGTAGGDRVQVSYRPCTGILPRRYPHC